MGKEQLNSLAEEGRRSCFRLAIPIFLKGIDPAKPAAEAQAESIDCDVRSGLDWPQCVVHCGRAIPGARVFPNFGSRGLYRVFGLRS